MMRNENNMKNRRMKMIWLITRNEIMNDKMKSERRIIELIVISTNK